MSLFPGGRSKAAGNPPSVEKEAMDDSMAGLIEEEFASMFSSIKGTPMPDADPADRRILFVAIARGVLRYLNEKQAGNIHAATLPTQVDVKFDINMDHF